MIYIPLLCWPRLRTHQLLAETETHQLAETEIHQQPPWWVAWVAQLLLGRDLARLPTSTAWQVSSAQTEAHELAET